MYDSILVATDGSDNAATAVDHAVELARQLERPLYGLAVVDTRTAYDSGIVDPEEVRARQHERAASALEALETRAAEAGVEAETTIRTGVPYEEIIAYATDNDLSVIVVGSRGRSGFREAVLGSTADALVRLATQPVLVVDA